MRKHKYVALFCETMVTVKVPRRENWAYQKSGITSSPCVLKNKTNQVLKIELFVSQVVIPMITTEASCKYF